MTGVPQKRRETHRVKNTKDSGCRHWRDESSESILIKPRNIKDWGKYQKLDETRKDLPLYVSDGAWPLISNF